MKKKHMLIIYFIITILFCLLGTKVFFSVTNLELYRNPDEFYKNACIYFTDNNIEDNQEFQYDGNYFQMNTMQCNYIAENYNKTGSFFLFFDRIITSPVFLFLFPMFVPVFVLIPIVFNFTREFEAGYIIYFLQRKSYKKYVTHLFKDSYKYFFPVFIILLYIIVLALILSHGNFDPRMDIYRSILGNDYLIFYNNFGNYIVYFIIILLNIFMYINIGLIAISHSKNFYIVLIESFLITFIFNCFTFVFVGVFLQNVFGIVAESVNVFEIYTWSNITNPSLFLIVNLVYYLISLIFVYFSYKNKEKIIMLCEV